MVLPILSAKYPPFKYLIVVVPIVPLNLKGGLVIVIKRNA
jgi:hypothetical protein